jgi:uncharacterized protein YndB with AHSA1/START domain
VADLQHAVSIAASPELVFEAIATAEGLASWWTPSVEHKGEGPAERFVFGFDDGNARASFRVEERDPPGRLVLACIGGIEDWQGTELVFQLDSIEGGTLLRFDHAGWTTQDWYFRQCNSTWGHLMYDLKRACEDDVQDPFFDG